MTKSENEYLNKLLGHDEITIPIWTRKDEINELVQKFRNDPTLLSDILIILRKDKIEKLRNRNNV